MAFPGAKTFKIHQFSKGKLVHELHSNSDYNTIYFVSKENPTYDLYFDRSDLVPYVSAIRANEHSTYDTLFTTERWYKGKTAPKDMIWMQSVNNKIPYGFIGGGQMTSGAGTTLIITNGKQALTIPPQVYTYYLSSGTVSGTGQGGNWSTLQNFSKLGMPEGNAEHVLGTWQYNDRYYTPIKTAEWIQKFNNGMGHYRNAGTSYYFFNNTEHSTYIGNLNTLLANKIAIQKQFNTFYNANTNISPASGKSIQEMNNGMWYQGLTYPSENCTECGVAFYNPNTNTIKEFPRTLLITSMGNKKSSFLPNGHSWETFKSIFEVIGYQTPVPYRDQYFTGPNGTYEIIKHTTGSYGASLKWDCSQGYYSSYANGYEYTCKTGTVITITPINLQNWSNYYSRKEAIRLDTETKLYRNHQSPQEVEYITDTIN
jgi:hypothetical protein